MRGSGGNAEAAEDAERFELPAELVAAIGQTRTEDACEVWADNWETVIAFDAIATQWRVATGMGAVAYIGLDYSAARAGLELADIKVTPELWEGLRMMEGEALRCLNAR